MRLKDEHCEKARRRAMKAKLFPDKRGLLRYPNVRPLGGKPTVRLMRGLSAV